VAEVTAYCPRVPAWRRFPRRRGRGGRVKAGRGGNRAPAGRIRFRAGGIRRVRIENGALSPYSARVIALLDYGSGNLRSVEKALRQVGADVRVTTRPEGMKHARAAVLPGVGAFDDCITALQR